MLNATFFSIFKHCEFSPAFVDLGCTSFSVFCSFSLVTFLCLLPPMREEAKLAKVSPIVDSLRVFALVLLVRGGACNVRIGCNMKISTYYQFS